MSAAWLAAATLAALVGFEPGPANVQQAYDAAKAETGARHHDDLKIRDAQCQSLKDAGRYACQIDYVRSAEPNGRLYFTVVTIEKRGQAWTLLGGLCRSAAS